MEKLHRAAECCQDSSWGAGRITVKSSAGKASLGWQEPLCSPCAISRAGAALAGLWLTVNRSPWPCLNKAAIAGVTDRTSCECLGRPVLNPRFMGFYYVAVSLSAPLHPFPILGLRVLQFAGGERCFQNNLCCFLNKTRSERKQNLDFVTANNDCDTYLLPKIKNHPAVAYGQTELIPESAWCG